MQSGTCHISIPLSLISLHIPNLNVDPWIQVGLDSLEDLYDGSSLKSFSELQNEYKLPLSVYIRYYQIVHLIKPITSKQCAIPSPVFSLMSCPLHLKTKSTRVFYNLFTNNDVFCQTPNILRWENCLGKQFSSAHCQSTIRWAHMSSSCANHREQFHKLLSRWYFTPLRLANSYSMASPYCWKPVEPWAHFPLLFSGLAHSCNLFGITSWVYLLSLHKNLSFYSFYLE